MTFVVAVFVGVGKQPQLILCLEHTAASLVNGGFAHLAIGHALCNGCHKAICAHIHVGASIEGLSRSLFQVSSRTML